MRKMLAATVLLVIGLVSTAHAEKAFVHHFDLAQVTTDHGKPRMLEMGYHFTAVRLGRRVELLGAGIGFDLATDQDGVYHPATFLVVPLVSVLLEKASGKAEHGDGYISFGANYIYHGEYGHRIALGFSIGLK